MEKINIAEILRHCPKGMELDCTIFDDVHFDFIDDVCDIINCYIQDSTKKIGISFSKYGCYSSISKSKCVIFPKGKTTWEGFQRSFKDGDVVATKNGIWIGIVKRQINCVYETYITINGEFLIYDSPRFCFERLATEEEKQKLFDAIKANGYKWNAETKTLEKLPKFKVGDRIKSKIDQVTYTITDIRSDVYIVNIDMDKFGYHIPFSVEKNYELVPNKFDITTFKPFDSRVLVRGSNDDIWKPAIWGIYNDIYCSAYPYITTYGATCQCIPYKDNQHLLGTTNDCDDYFKTWE